MKSGDQIFSDDEAGGAIALPCANFTAAPDTSLVSGLLDLFGSG
jgi:hypothetical protein